MGTSTSPLPVEHRSDALTVMRRMFDEGFATGGTAVVDELCAADLVEHQFGMAGVGADAIQHVKDAIRASPRGHPGHVVHHRGLGRARRHHLGPGAGEGTATGPFFGPPSGRPVDITVVDIARIVDGRIVEHWGVPDRFALLAQTGILNRLA